MTVVNTYSAIGEWRPGAPFSVRETPESIEFSSLELWETFELGRALAAWAGVAMAAGWTAVNVELDEDESASESTGTVDVEPAGVEESASHPDEKRCSSAKDELQKFVSWGEGPGRAGYDRARIELVLAAGSEEAATPLIEAATARGRAIAQARSTFSSFLRTRDPESKEVLDELRRLKKTYWEAASGFRRDHEWRRSQVAKARNQEENRREKRALTSVKGRPGIPHRVDRLEPSSSWTVYVDETGTFENPNQKSIIVGLFVPAGIDLPPLPDKWHATNRLPHELDAVVQQVLDVPVGLLGVRADPESWIDLEPWIGTLLAFIEAAVRLLPIPSQGRSRVTFLIEQRGDVSPNGEVDDRPLRAAMVQLRRELKKRHPLRESAFDISAQVVTKRKPLLGYVDTVACTLGSPTPEAKARVREAQLSDYLVAATSTELVTLLDDAAKAESVREPERWRLALSLGTSAPLIVTDALERLKTRVREGALPFFPFVSAVKRHLESKAVDRLTLSRELAWLDDVRGNVPLPGRISLEYAMARQETLNHRGAFDDDVATELARLAWTLRDEFPDRACQADLVLAVSETNRFRFDAAEQRLLPWLEHPVAVPGLRHTLFPLCQLTPA